MRIFKLSKTDDDMPTRAAALKFFTDTLWKRSPVGRFGLTKDKAKMRGISDGTLILFTYGTECLFIGRASGPIDVESKSMPLDMASLAPISGWLADFQEAAHQAGVTTKELVHTQSWPGIDATHDDFAKEYFNYGGRQRFLFVRVGWMKYYQGPIDGDERPVGGGDYNKDKVGFEVCNFLPLRKRCYGYFQPQMRSDRTNLERIDRMAKRESRLDNVTVIWVATRPGHAQVIVGWWRNALVYRDEGPVVRGRLDGFDRYRVIASRGDCLLVPETERTNEVPRGGGGIGQANICYPLEQSGERRAFQWMFKARVYIEEFQRGLRPTETSETNAKAAQGELEQAEEKAKGQGFRQNAAERKAIEDYGMELATEHYVDLGYDVSDVSKKKPYDLLCVKDGQELHVEVKATTTPGKKVFLTRREADLAASTHGNRALFIVHSIKLKEGKVSGGRKVLHEPWKLDWEHTQEELYSYRPPEGVELR